MNPFTYENRVKLVFGEGTLEKVGDEVLALSREKAKVLVVYGGGSVKRSGVFDRVVGNLKTKGLEVFERGGVRPNPTVEFVRETVQVIRERKIDVLLALGGGSVIDTVKASALGEAYEGDVWDYFLGKTKTAARLPIVTVLTIPAAGSEQSSRCVINNGVEKRGIGGDQYNFRARVSIVDPMVFVTLPHRQMASGVTDIMSHIFERYFTNTTHVDFTTQEAEAALRVAIANGRLLNKDINDVKAWSEVGLTGSFAHCGYFGMGHVEDWACHGIEHALSGLDPAIVHGEGLAVLIPSWMKVVYRVNPDRFERFARFVMGVKPRETREKTILAGIEALSDFYKEMGMPRRLGELSANPVDIERAADLAIATGPLGHFKPLTREDVIEILKLSQ